MCGRCPDKLKLNASRTEAMTITSKINMAHVIKLTIKIDDETIAPNRLSGTWALH